MEVEKRAKVITEWINNYCDSASYKPKALIVGISGGVDSSVVSTLCALTNLEVYAVSMPINQIKSQHDLSLDHGKWLTENYKNVHHLTIDLSSLYNHFQKSLDLSSLMGYLATVLASINVFGGFVVTQRMLAMYKKKNKND